MGLQRVGHNWAVELNWTDWMITDVEHLAMCLCGHLFTFFLLEMSFQILCLFLNWVVLLNFSCPLYILDITSLSGTSFVNIFSQSVGCLFTLSVFLKHIFSFIHLAALGLFFSPTYFFLYFWLCCVFSAALGLSLLLVSRDTLRCGAQASLVVSSHSFDSILWSTKVFHFEEFQFIFFFPFLSCAFGVITKKALLKIFLFSSRRCQMTKIIQFSSEFAVLYSKENNQ